MAITYLIPTKRGMLPWSIWIGLTFLDGSPGAIRHGCLCGLLVGLPIARAAWKQVTLPRGRPQEAAQYVPFRRDQQRFSSNSIPDFPNKIQYETRKPLPERFFISKTDQTYKCPSAISSRAYNCAHLLDSIESPTQWFLRVSKICLDKMIAFVIISD